jgi:hypothetical protein
VRRGCIVVLVALAVGALVAPGVATADATVGRALITQAGTDRPLNSGASTTLYGVSLPAGASCSGDTAHKQYHVFTYLFPVDVAPTAVSFKTGEPSDLGTNGHFGFISGGQYVGALNTAPVTGEVVDLPEHYTWSRLTAADLFSAGQTRSSWNAGIACADPAGAVTDYWNAEIVFTASAAVPGGFTWAVAPSDAASTGRSLRVGVTLLIIAVALGLVAFAINRRRRSARDHVTA